MLLMVLLMPVLALAGQAINVSADSCPDKASAADGKCIVVEPSGKSYSSFAIVVDMATYNAVRAGIEAYRDAVEKDGLPTYIVAGEWSRPDEIKAKLMELAKGEMPIEGAVFVGDIPVVMSRDAQHLASAFTAHQSSDFKESSIATDRFYDDFDLKWNFIRRDEDLPHYYYYSLSYDSPQAVKTDIYSARIRPTGENKYEKLEKYLAKVVAAHNEANLLDDLFMFRGTSYNSESLDGWSCEQIVLREQMPGVFGVGGTVRFVDFDTKYPVKNYILEYLRRDALDVVIGHHHGSHTRQYLNDDMKAYSVSEAIEMVQSELRSKIRRQKDKAAAMARLAEEYGVSQSWIDTTREQRKLDREREVMKDIYLEDIYEMKPNAKFVVFDACDNGSFHVDDCVANAYIFSEGKCVATQGNTVGSIQDKHPNAYIGLMAQGLRVGQWSRYAQNFLGSHIVGDPTFRFAAPSCCTSSCCSSKDINQAVVTKAGDNEFWLGVLADKSYDKSGSDWYAMAVRMLADNDYAGIDKLAYDLFMTSPYGSVRMECLKALYNLRAFPKADPNAVGASGAADKSARVLEVMSLAMNDSYELVRRFATENIGTMGDPVLLKDLVNAVINERISARVEYRAKDNLKVFTEDAVDAELDKQLAEQTYIITGEKIKSSVAASRNWHLNFISELREGLKVDNFDAHKTEDGDASAHMVTARGVKDITVKNSVEQKSEENAKEKEFIRTITLLRNSNCHFMVPEVISYVEDLSKPVHLRVIALEILGWFNASYRNPEIASLCNRILKSHAPDELRQEAHKTLNRMQY